MSHAGTALGIPRDTTPLLQRPYMSPYKKPPWYRQTKFYLNLIRRSLAEFIGTGLFVFTAISASSNIAPDARYDVQTSSATVVALAGGLSYAALVAATMHVSGGHLNPAVTLGVFLAGGVNVLAAICYFFAQLIGSLTGAACVLAYDTVMEDSNGTWSVVDYGVTRLSPSFSPSQGILVEMLLTLMLVMVFIHTTMEKMEYRTIAPLAVGVALVAGVLASYSITGGSLNPARSLGPAVVASSKDRWKDHYIYWVGPFLGAILAGVFYRLFLSSKPLVPLSEPEPKTVVHS